MTTYKTLYASRYKYLKTRPRRSLGFTVFGVLLVDLEISPKRLPSWPPCSQRPWLEFRCPINCRPSPCAIVHTPQHLSFPLPNMTSPKSSANGRRTRNNTIRDFTGTNFKFSVFFPPVYPRVFSRFVAPDLILSNYANYEICHDRIWVLEHISYAYKQTIVNCETHVIIHKTIDTWK